MIVNIASAPLVAFGLGQAMGGDGNVGTTYEVGLLPFSVGAGASTVDPLVLLSIEMALEPFCAALGYEVSSTVNAQKVLGTRGWIRPTLSPVLARGDSLQGVKVGAVVAF
jgi:hypothetical protein